MPFKYSVPGVYKEVFTLKPEGGLPTGVPGFVGFADPPGGGGSGFNRPVALYRKDDFDEQFKARPDSFLSEVVNGFFLNGGKYCYVVAAESDPNVTAERALTVALDSLSTVPDLDLIAIPDAMTACLSAGKLDTQAITSAQADSVIRVQGEMLKHCSALGNRMALLDALPGQSTDGVLSQRGAVGAGVTEPVSGALYYPWLKVAPGSQPSVDVKAYDDGAVDYRLTPPCGHVAGIIARSDQKVGVFKAPANEEITGIFDLEINIDAKAQASLNPQGVNCLRAFPGRGIRIWGARTISRAPDWQYINVRRLFITLQRWVDARMAWAAFEPNTPTLWVRINRELSSYLDELWKAGALAGRTAEDAFYVKCDAETNPPEVRGEGRTVTEVGLAPLAPAEYVVVRIVHQTGVEPR